MSSLKTYNIQHPNSSSVNVGLNSDGSAVVRNVTGGVVVSGVTTVSSLVANNSIYTGITTTSTNKTLSNRELCTVIGVGIGTTAGITVTLPSSPSSGWEVGVAIAGTFTDTVVARNGSNIMGLAENLTLNLAYSTVRLVYTDTNGGWRIF